LIQISKQEAVMRVPFLVVAVAAATLLRPDTGHAYYQGPWCTVQPLGAGAIRQDCSMQTFEQCRMETIAGNRGYCVPNPRYRAAVEEPRRPRKRRVRRR
jgi:Protein of unknown function (DUF3551)